MAWMVPTRDKNTARAVRCATFGPGKGGRDRSDHGRVGHRVRARGAKSVGGPMQSWQLREE
eukprot:9942179-Lingulodinium_polyedra.AAC.1